MREIIKKIPFLKIFHYFFKNRKTENSSKILIYIHIGKCGGGTLGRAIRNSHKTKSFSKIHSVHVSKPPVFQNGHYAIVIRNPIQRAISAFNWRYKFVVEDGTQKNRFKGEYDTLLKYKNLNSLAEALYTDDKLNKEVENEFRTIHHLKEDISFYLNDLLGSISGSQIFAVFSTESLDKDIMLHLDIKNELRIHKNSSSTSKKSKQLSEVSYRNLKRFLSNDYRCIERLLEFNDATFASKDILLK